MNDKKNSTLALGTESIGKLLTQYAMPAIIAMTASSLYNMTDSIFIGQGVGAMAIAGLALTFPLMNFAAAFGSLVGVGASTLVSMKLGQKDYRGANNVLGNVLMLNVILGVIFTVVVLCFLEPIFKFFGASEQTLPYAVEYMRIILYGNVVTHMYLGLNSVLRSSGYPKMAMLFTLSSVVINCILSYIFIFVFDWGIDGAAWATVIAQGISLIGQFFHFADSKQLLHFKKGIYKLRKDLVRDMLSIGMSPFLMNACSSVVIILINQNLYRYGGDMAIGAYGIVNRIVFLFLMVVLGLNQGMQPIAGYNFGARQYDRVTGVTKLTVFCAVCVTTFGFLLSEIWPSLIVKWFTSDEELIAASVYGIRIVFAVFPIVGFQMVTTNFFLSIGKAKIAIFLSLTRQVLFLIPCLLILPGLLQDVKGVWISLPIADVTAAVVTAVMLVYQFRQFNKMHEETQTIEK
jgi:putative MATE family efflux protein